MDPRRDRALPPARKIRPKSSFVSGKHQLHKPSSISMFLSSVTAGITTLSSN